MGWLLAFVVAISSPLCVDGHPAHREAHVTYGGLLPRHGYERDHVIPLCLGGPDERSNVQYQPWPDYYMKDRREWAACQMYCAGIMSLEAAKNYVTRWQEDE